jgi:hypothetical protein
MTANVMKSRAPYESEGNRPTAAARARSVALSVVRAFARKAKAPEPRRLLFLDDDPRRAETFLAENPDAVWVKTVVECLDRMTEAWDEIHLDHDLGGRQFVDTNQDDCGMEIIRWMCKEPRPHLNDTAFFVHTHNSVAGLLMVLQMRTSGYKAEFRPFGFDVAKLLAHNEPESGAPPGPPARTPASQPNGFLTRLKSIARWMRPAKSMTARPPDPGPHQTAPKREEAESKPDNP